MRLSGFNAPPAAWQDRGGKNQLTAGGAGLFVVSLDLELMWGMRDHATTHDYGHRILGERQAVPAMLDLFEQAGIHATWATVGFLLCDGRDELLARAPEERPTYADPKLSNYAYLDEVGVSERADPYYFAPSMVRRILECPHQEIATHSYSHYYCLEPGQTEAQFSADLRTAIAQLRDWNLDCRSIVFPRNQYDERHLALCAAEGLTVFRGTETNWMYQPGNGAAQSLLRRAARLTDTYYPLSGTNAFQLQRSKPLVNVPSSRFLRPYKPNLKLLENTRFRRIRHAMAEAARSGQTFHLWWHPHNFGADIAENMAFLRRIIDTYRELADRFGMISANISEAADALLEPSPHVLGKTTRPVASGV